ncbi:hypothetical protein [Actinoalloteichus spitiensis]|uniref:hypothetical protein n=1 Tax=Actinoalloteichus spitiensis TaxID=252394 RepID=UPI00036AD48C|nr:hypothetical protein [Actinoalloteichus spitiensis]
MSDTRRAALFALGGVFLLAAVALLWYPPAAAGVLLAMAVGYGLISCANDPARADARLWTRNGH